MALSIVQTKPSITGATGTPPVLTLAFTNPIAAGSIIAIATGYDSGNGLTSLTFATDKGDAYTSAIAQHVNNNIAANAAVQAGAFLRATTGAQTITITFNGSSGVGFSDAVIWEIAGFTGAVIDKTPIADGLNGTTEDSGATGTLSASNEAAICYCLVSSALAQADVGAGWSNAVTTNLSSGGESRIVASNASINGTWTNSAAGNWTCLAVTFNDSSATPTTAGFFIEDTVLQRPPQNQRMMRPDHLFATPAQPLPVNQNAAQPSAAGVVKIRMIPY